MKRAVDFVLGTAWAVMGALTWIGTVNAPSTFGAGLACLMIGILFWDRSARS